MPAAAPLRARSQGGARQSVAFSLHSRRLSRSFYARPVLEVARDCIGKILVRTSPEGLTAGRIVEAEAYRGPEDLAAHSARGRRTARTEVMFGPAGHSYVFLIYGLHFHFNIVTGNVGEPHAVLIRAVEPVEGSELMAHRRGIPADRAELTNGPGKLTQAFAIDRSEYGADLCTSTTLYVADGAPPPRIGRTRRIGVDYSGVWATRPWRFYAVGNRYVSRPPKGAEKTR